MMKKTRMIAAGAAAVLTLSVGAGFAAAQADPGPTTAPIAGATGMQTADMDEMHTQMRSNMPDNMQQQHDTMHAAMQDRMGRASMQGRLGTMANGAMMGR